MAALAELKRNYYIAALGLSDSEAAKMTNTDLEYAFFLNPPASGGGGADPTAVHPEDLAPVAFTGVYTDLTSKPAIPASKSDIGLGNVDNTADASKPISTAVSTALAAKATTTALGLKADATDVALRPIICIYDGTSAYKTLSGGTVPTDPDLVRWYDTTNYVTASLPSQPTAYSALDKWFDKPVS